MSVFGKDCRLIAEKGCPTKMLMCSMRISPPTGDGSVASRHEKVAAGDIVYTCPPGYIAELMGVEDALRPFSPAAIDEEPPRETLERLLRLPYFVEAYEPTGMSAREFNRQGALVATAAEFSKATRTVVDFVAQQFDAR